MRYIMTFLETNLKEGDKWTDLHDTTTVKKMYRDVQHCLVMQNDGRINIDGRWDSHLKWHKIVNLLCKIEQQRQGAGN